jgi:dihydrofolate synthase/folylpolyglutamate synthase
VARLRTWNGPGWPRLIDPARRPFWCTLRAGKVRAVFGVSADKDPESVTKPLSSLVDTWYLTASRDARAMPTEQLVERLAGVLPGDAVEVYPTVRSALDAALATSVPGDCLLVCGSFTTVGEALTGLDHNPGQRRA